MVAFCLGLILAENELKEIKITVLKTGQQNIPLYLFIIMIVCNQYITVQKLYKSHKSFKSANTW